MSFETTRWSLVMAAGGDDSSAARAALASGGAINFHVASLYPTLYRMEDKGTIEGRWVEKAGQRRRRYYRLTPAGRKTLASQRSVWGPSSKG